MKSVYNLKHIYIQVQFEIKGKKKKLTLTNKQNNRHGRQQKTVKGRGTEKYKNEMQNGG